MRENFVVHGNQFDGVALLPMPSQVCEVGAPGTFYEQSPDFEDRLDRSEGKLLRELVSVLDKVLLNALSSRTLSEFEARRATLWPRYIRSSRALSDTLSNLLPGEARYALNRTSLTALEEALPKHEERFGEALTEQGLFTIFTVRRMRSIGREIERESLPREKRGADAALLSEYSGTAYWSAFHLDLMVAAMKFDRPVPEELRESLCEGLRASVNAYVIMKEALLLRTPPRTEETTGPDFIWDQEDEDLLASSMRDLDAHNSNDGDTAR